MLKKNEAAPGDGAAPDDEHTENYNNFEPVSQRRYNLLDERVFNAFYKRWEIIEIRIIGAYGNDQLWEGYARGTVAGYFDDRDIFLSVVRALALSQKKYNVYFTLQIPDPRLIGRADNRLRANIQTTSDNNVRFYRWIPIDCDPVRPAGISASETELARAILLRNQIRDFILMTCDFKHVVTAVSGKRGACPHQTERRQGGQCRIHRLYQTVYRTCIRAVQYGSGRCGYYGL